MSNWCFNSIVAAGLVLLANSGNAVSEHATEFTGSLSQHEQRCLTDMLRNGHWRHSPQFHETMQHLALVAQAHLGTSGRTDYVYIMRDSEFCGTAGCSMLIGEAGQDGTCRELFDGSGFVHAIKLLHKRDHGYRRLYTPCELRFDGRENRQLHDACPTLDVPR